MYHKFINKANILPNDQDIAAPNKPYLPISKKATRRIIGNRINCCLAVTSGIPSAWKNVNGIKFNELAKTPNERQ